MFVSVQFLSAATCSWLRSLVTLATGTTEKSSWALESRSGRWWRSPAPTPPKTWETCPLLFTDSCPLRFSLKPPPFCLLTALLGPAVNPRPGRGRRGQLLHHRSHHHRRPLRQREEDQHAVRLLFRHPRGQVRTGPAPFPLFPFPHTDTGSETWEQQPGDVPGPITSSTHWFCGSETDEAVMKMMFYLHLARQTHTSVWPAHTSLKGRHVSERTTRLFFMCLTSRLVCPLSGLGYIVGSQVSNITKDWHWALRVRVILFIFNSFICRQSENRNKVLKSNLLKWAQMY